MRIGDDPGQPQRIAYIDDLVPVDDSDAHPVLGSEPHELHLHHTSVVMLSSGDLK